MVYKKYIRKNGKRMGPYYYESYRDGDKIKSKYLGTELPEEYSKNNVKSADSPFALRKTLLISSFVIIMVFFLGGYLTFLGLSGRAVLNVNEQYGFNESLKGNVSLVIEANDRLSKDLAVSLVLSRSNEVVVQTTKTLEEFIGNQANYEEINSTTQTCSPISVLECNNVTTENETKEVCENSSTGESCVNSTTSGFYYTTPGTYSVPIESLISYTFSEGGNYNLVFEIPELNLEASASIIVSLNLTENAANIATAETDNKTIEQIGISAFSGTGDGSSGNPYNITNCTQLQEMGDSLAANYILGNNVNCSDTINWNSGAGFNPVGNISNSFTGTLDGRNYNITGLNINRLQDYVGLFGYITSSGIKASNLGLIKINITTNGTYVGGIVGVMGGGILQNIYTSGSINADYGAGGSYGVGGLVGSNLGAVRYSHSDVSVTGGRDVGGVAGENIRGNIISSYSAGNITGYTDVGGIAGVVAGSGGSPVGMFSSYSAGNVSGENCVGGAVGLLQDETTEAYDGAIAKSSFSTAFVSGSTNVGGFLGCEIIDFAFNQFSDNYWYNATSLALNCSGDSSKDCTVVNDSNYFKGLSVTGNAPMDGWNFVNFWQAVAGDYPKINLRGTFTASLVSPTSNTVITRGNSFSFNSSVSCASGPCSGVYALINPVVVNTTVGAVPFYTTSSNPQACGDLADGDSCTNNWTIFANGSAAMYEFYVSYNSTNTAISSANTSLINITINEVPRVKINSPTATTYTTATVGVNIGIDESGYCTYSLNSGFTNLTLTANSTNSGFNGTTASLSNGNYVLHAYCNDSFGLVNNSESVSFTISVSSGGGGGGGGGCTPSYDHCSPITECVNKSIDWTCADVNHCNVPNITVSSGCVSGCTPDYSSCSPYVPERTGIIYGDIDGDRKLTVGDVYGMVSLVLRLHILSQSSDAFTTADVNGDGAVTLVDLNILVDRILGRIDKFPVEPYPPTDLVPVCDNGQMLWICKDTKCGLADKNEYRACDVNCIPDYSSCGEWSICKENIQGRTCDDTRCNYPAKDFARECVSCAPNWSCTGWGGCANNKMNRTCTDLNSCNINVERPAELMDCGCQSNFICENWGVCTYEEGMDDLFNWTLDLHGIQARECVDINHCSKNYTLYSNCTTGFNITLTKENICGENSLLVSNAITDRPVSIISLDTLKNDRLDLSFVQAKTKYCSTCYNGVKDGDEKGVDCGGSCPSCVNEPRSWLWLIILILAVIECLIAKYFYKDRDYVQLEYYRDYYIIDDWANKEKIDIETWYKNTKYWLAYKIKIAKRKH